MKILMATMGLDIGGAETHIVELSKELKSRGHQVAVVSNGGVYVPEIEAAGIRHYAAPLNRRSVGSMLQAQRILRQVIAREKPDIVHAHARIPAFLCGRLQKSMGFAFVTSCHGVYQVSGALRLLSNWGERTLAVSEDIRDYLVRQYNVPQEHITLTINGIDTDKFSPALTGEAVRREFDLGDGPVIAHVSRLDPETVYTARQLVELAPALCRDYPGLHILIVGGGGAFEPLKAQAEEVNRKLGRPCVILTGPRTDVNQLVAACGLFVGVSRAALEAMAACKPVVLSGAQGHTGLFCPELLDKAVDTNFCCRTDPVSTPEQLQADILRALALSPDRARELGDYGRRVVQERYSVHRMADDCLAVYDQVRRPFHVVMSGYYGFSNAGDDAILEAIQQAIHEASDHICVTALSNDPELTRRQYGLEAIPRFRVLKVFSALRRCDALLSGGGSLLQDTTSTRSLLYYLTVIRCAHWLGKPVMLYANGIGPVRRPANRRRVKRVVEQATLITLRDHSSARELQDMGVTRTDLHVTADPVFHLSPAPETRGGAAGRGRRGPRHALCGRVRAGLAGHRGLLPPTCSAVRPPPPGIRPGRPLPAYAAQPGPGHRPAGAVLYGGALLSAGRPLHPPGADGRAGQGQAVSGHAAAHSDLRRPDGRALHGSGVRPQGGQLSEGAGPARCRACGLLRRTGGHPPGRRPHGRLPRRALPPEGELRRHDPRRR